jgi:hypothetical protein
MGYAYRDIEEAYLFVNAGPEFEHNAVLCKDTGEIYYASGDDDEMTLPDFVDGNDSCIEIPHKNELNLGTRLVFDFVAQHCPDLSDQIRQMFSRKGAYSRFKDILDEKHLLNAWHDFEDARRAQALRQWCADNGIEVDG